jgi:hypothetical protein
METFHQRHGLPLLALCALISLLILAACGGDQIAETPTEAVVSEAVAAGEEPASVTEPTESPSTPTSTPIPTNTPVPPTSTPVPPTSTPVPPTNTLVPPTNTPVPPTNTPVPPTNTPVPPTNTPVPPTNTPIPPADTPTQVPAAGGQIVITAVNKRDEYVDLSNIGGQAVDLGGWRLVSEKGNQECWLGGVVQPGATLRVWALASDADKGGYNCNFGSPIWNNSEPDPAALYDSTGTLVDRYP